MPRSQRREAKTYRQALAKSLRDGCGVLRIQEAPTLAMRKQPLLPLCLSALIPGSLLAQGIASPNAQPVKALEASGLP